jgi:melibiose permease/lactose/raffinose/galactose permease
VVFSTTYSLNDIAYWGMLPALSSEPGERHRLVSVSNICAGAGAAVITVFVPMLTAGKNTIGGNALTAYAVISAVVALSFLGFQSLPLAGVKEPRAEADKTVSLEKLGFKNTVLTVVRNDQLLWASAVLLIQGVMSGVGPAGAGISMAYIYLKYGYNGMLMTFSMAGGISSVFVTLLLPKILEKISRKRLLYLSVVATAIGAALLLLSGLVLPKEPWWLSFGVYAFSSAFVIGGGVAFYQVLFIDIANTVEYDEWKTGRRSEGLIFSLRPMMTKMASGIVQLIVTVIFLALGITNINRDISDLENAAERLLITPEGKLTKIEGLLDAVPDGKAAALLLCLALIPTVIAIGGYWIYKTKFKLDEEKYAEILKDLEARKAE